MVGVELAVPFGWVAPGRLAEAEPVLDRFTGFTEHHRDILEGMHAIADEKRHHDNILRACDPVTIADARLFLHEHCMHLGIEPLRANQLRLALD